MVRFRVRGRETIMSMTILTNIAERARVCACVCKRMCKRMTEIHSVCLTVTGAPLLALPPPATV